MGMETSVGVNDMPRVATRTRPIVGPEQGPRKAALPSTMPKGWRDMYPPGHFRTNKRVPKVPHIYPAKFPKFRLPIRYPYQPLFDLIPDPGAPVRNPADYRFQTGSPVLQRAVCPNFFGNSGTDYTGKNGVYAMVWNGGTPSSVVCLEAQSWGFPLEIARPDGTLTGNIYNFGGPGFRMVTIGPRNNSGNRYKNSIAELYQVPGPTSAPTLPGWTYMPGVGTPANPNRTRTLPAEPQPDHFGFPTKPGELAPGVGSPAGNPFAPPRILPRIPSNVPDDDHSPPTWEPLPRVKPGVVPTVPWTPIGDDTPITKPFPTVVITPAPSSPAPGTKTGDIVKTPGRPHTRTPPRKREKEKKVMTRSARQLRAIFAALDTLSEYGELVDALFDALPDDVKKRWSKDRENRGLLDQAGQYGIDGADWKIQALWHNWHRIDGPTAFKNIVGNEVQDKLLGLLNRNLPRNQGHAFDSGMKGVNDWITSSMGTIGFA